MDTVFSLKIPCHTCLHVMVQLAVWEIVLYLAGLELIFLIAASVGLCFEFVLKTVLITQGCFSYC